MRYTTLLASVLVLSTHALVASAQGMRAPPRAGGQPPAAALPVYDVKSVVTVEGTLTAIDTLLPMSGMPGEGLHGMLTTASSRFPVHFGPLQFWSRQKVRLVVGDKVSITGSKVVMTTIPTILAASVVKGADTVKLRDDNGFPLWRGMRRGARP